MAKLPKVRSILTDYSEEEWLEYSKGFVIEMLPVGSPTGEILKMTVVSYLLDRL
jgi:hypothetical protein